MNIHAGKYLLVGLMALVLLLGSMPSWAHAIVPRTADESDLFVRATQVYGDVKDDPTIIRARWVDINAERVAGVNAMANSRAQGSTSLRLHLFDDVIFTAIIELVEANASGGFTWMGHVQGVQHSEVIFVVKDGVLVGNVALPDAFYQVRYTPSGDHVIYQIDQRAFPPEAEPVPVNLPGEAQPLAPGAVTADDGSQIDVLVVYTGAARAGVGGTTAMNNLITLAETETNMGYANSDVNQRIHLVHTAEVSYDESGFNWSTTLARLRGETDGYMDDVHSLRDTYLADMVVLIVNDTNSCGIGYLMTSVASYFEAYAFSVVSQDCATGYYSFAHEMGHNMGCHHDRANADGTGAYPYSYGYQAPDKAFRTIMAYNCTSPGCTRVNHWSNPDVSYGGQPTGVLYTAPNSADNRRTLNNTAYTVANFRASAPDTQAPTGSININSGAAYTSNRTVSLALSASDNVGVTEMRLDYDGSWQAWESFASSKSVTVPAGDGAKTVKVQYRDDAGNVSATYSDSIGLDATPPSSQVNTLPAMQGNPSFNVSWSGSDAGSGIACYDVQFRDGSGGAWTDWRTCTASSSGTFSGVDGHSYYFRSRAKDNLDNLESYPASPDAFTTIASERLYLPLLFKGLGL